MIVFFFIIDDIFASFTSELTIRCHVKQGATPLGLILIIVNNRPGREQNNNLSAPLTVVN